LTMSSLITRASRFEKGQPMLDRQFRVVKLHALY
jgi:hypothetical protein